MTRARACLVFAAAACIGWVGLAGTGTSAVSLLLAAEPLGAVALKPCEVPGVARPARCGALDVPENPDRPSGRRLQLGVMVVPASGGSALPDPVVPLMGGPGEDAISAAPEFVTQLGELLRDRDLLLIDQRGTGRSGALRCDLHSADTPETSLRDLFPPAAVEQCAQQLSAGADLTQYRYTHFAHDLEHARRALGYGPLNLFAGSYGTRAAQVYVHAYPQSVRTAYLGSVVPIDIATPLTMAKTVQALLESTFDACAADGPCRAAFPKLREEFRGVWSRLQSGEVRVRLPGRTGSAPLQRGPVAEWFRSLLYRPGTAATVPWLIHHAHSGDWTPVVEGILSRARGLGSALSVGLFFSITCNDDIAFVREEDIEPETRGTFLGDYRVRQQQAACRKWPKVAVPPDDRRPVRSAVPALFVSGDADGASPLWFTERVAPGFSDRAEVVHRGRGHTEWSDCVAGIYERFVRGGRAQGLDARCPVAPRPPFKTQ